MKLKDLLNEKKNDQGVLVVTKKAEVNKFIKQVEKAEKELNKAKDLFSDLELKRTHFTIMRETLVKSLSNTIQIMLQKQKTFGLILQEA